MYSLTYGFPRNTDLMCDKLLKEKDVLLRFNSLIKLLVGRWNWSLWWFHWIYYNHYILRLVSGENQFLKEVLICCQAPSFFEVSGIGKTVYQLISRKICVPKLCRGIYSNLYIEILVIIDIIKSLGKHDLKRLRKKG